MDNVSGHDNDGVVVVVGDLQTFIDGAKPFTRDTNSATSNK